MLEDRQDMKATLDPETGIRLRRMLIGTGVTQGEIARRLGWPSSELSRMLSGHRTVPERFAEDYQAAFEAASLELRERGERASREVQVA